MIRRLWKEIRALAIFFLLIAVSAAIAWVAIHKAGKEFQYTVTEYAKMHPQPVLGSRLPSEMRNPTADHSYRSIQTATRLLLVFQLIVLHMAAVLAWGKEFHLSAIQRLLSQPVSRNRIWLEKTIALAALVFCVIAIDTALCFYAIHEGHFAVSTSYGNVGSNALAWSIRRLCNKWLFFTVTVSLSAFACGPFFSLLLRQAHTAFWASLLAPVGFILLATYMNLSPVASIMAGQFNGMPLILIWFSTFFLAGWLTFRRLEV